MLTPTSVRVWGELKHDAVALAAFYRGPVKIPGGIQESAGIIRTASVSTTGEFIEYRLGPGPVRLWGQLVNRATAKGVRLAAAPIVGRAVEVPGRIKNYLGIWKGTIAPALKTVECALGPGSVQVACQFENGAAAGCTPICGCAVEITCRIQSKAGVGRASSNRVELEHSPKCAGCVDRGGENKSCCDQQQNSARGEAEVCWIHGSTSE